jgi:HEAT repeat protein
MTIMHRRRIGLGLIVALACVSLGGAKPSATATQKATKLLIDASVSQLPILRANAIEAMQVSPTRALPLTQRGLSDRNPGVRFAAVVTAGQLNFDSMESAIRPLVADPNPSVRAAAIFALHKFGDDIDITPLADMLASQDPGLRANVAMLLGLMGDKSAIPMLHQAGDAPMPRVGEDRVALVRIQIAEAIAKLGDDKALNAVRAGVHSSIGEVQIVAINAVGALGDEKGAAVLQTLLENQPIEVQLAAAGAIARVARKKNFTEQGMGQWMRTVEDRARPIALAQATSPQGPIRAQVAWTLGWFDDAQTLAAAEQLLEDPDWQVRIAAAASVVRRAHRR